MSDDDQGDDDLDFDFDFDFIGENIKLADAGENEAVGDLLHLVAGQLCMGQIADHRLRRWLADYLSRAAKKLYESDDVGAPTKGEIHKLWALGVEKECRKLIAEGKEKGAQSEAIRRIAGQVHRSEKTVGQVYKDYRDWAGKHHRDCAEKDHQDCAGSELERLEKRGSGYLFKLAI